MKTDVPWEFWTFPQSTYRGDPIGGYLRSLDFSVLGPHEFYYMRFGHPDLNGVYAMEMPLPVEMMDAASAYPTAVRNAAYGKLPETEFMVVYPNQRVTYHCGLTLEQLADYLTENEAWLPGQRFVVYRKPVCNDEVPEHVATIGLHDKPYAIMRCGE